MESGSQRSVKISDDDRGAWTSDRPRRPGESERPPRKPDVSVRGRVLAPAERLRYSPGSLLLVASPDPDAADRLATRVVAETAAVLSTRKVRGLLEGRVPEGEMKEKAQALLDAAAGKRLAAGQTVVIPLDGLDPAERERYVQMAAANRRPRHLILVDVARDQVGEDDRAALSALRAALDAGELGAEGFVTSLRLGGRAIDELKRIVFQPPPAED
jgi:predicted kinase